VPGLKFGECYYIEGDRQTNKASSNVYTAWDRIHFIFNDPFALGNTFFLIFPEIFTLSFTTYRYYFSIGVVDTSNNKFTYKF